MLRLGLVGGLSWGFRFCRFLEVSVEEVVLANHSAQSPASVCVVIPGHAMGHCKVGLSLCSVRLVWQNLAWGLKPGLAGGL